MRIQVARASREFPELVDALAEHRISLTVAGLLCAHLSRANVSKLLSRCERKTRREVEEELVCLSPKPMARSQIRKRPASAVEPADVEVYNFSFSANKAFREKLERLAEVLGIHNPSQKMPEVLEKALELALQKRDPRRKLARRVKREQAQERERDLEKSAMFWTCNRALCYEAPRMTATWKNILG